MKFYDYGLNLKKRQRKVNRTIRAINKCLAEDDVWKGRFEIKQFDRSWYVFEDGSGAVLNVYVEVYDKLTGKRMAYGVGCENLNKLWYAVNDFITKEVRARCEYLGDFTDVKAEFLGRKNDWSVIYWR